MARARYYSRASMAALARDAAKLGIRHDTSLASTVVALPPLRSGAPFLQHWKTHQEPGGALWQDESYTTYSPWTFTLPDAVVHSAAGIVCVGDDVIEETLVHSDPVLLNEVGYDCVLGRLIGPWPTLPGAVHSATWQISIPHVVAALAHA